MPVARSNIATISIQNFKFFHQQEKFELNGAHLLLYGENGSGKSSLYWALYTLLECANKQNVNEIKKYFDPTKDQKLTNLFLVPGNPDWIDSEIKILLQDGTDINVSFANTSINGNTDAQAANYATEFLNYKMLFRMHNFSHSANVDLFPYFEHEVLPYVKFSPMTYWVKNLDETPLAQKQTENAKEIWDYIRSGPPRTGTTSGGRLRYPLRREPESREYFRLISAFKSELDQLLTFVNTQGNPILLNELKYPLSFKLGLVEKKPLRLTSLQFAHPRFEVKLTIPQFVGKPDVPKPHTFLNEARLSAIGLALRFAILKKRLQDSKLKMAILDDFMISLDMRNRDVALDYILDKVAPEYQLLILTHDRFLYELASDKISRKGLGNWKRYYMFEDSDDPPTKLFPVLIKDEGKVMKARALFKSKDFTSSANMIRQATEKLCDKYLTPQEKLANDYTSLNLEKKLRRVIQKGRRNGLDHDLLHDVYDYKNRIMNPNSHYDIETPLFSHELEKAIKTLEALSAVTGIQL